MQSWRCKPFWLSHNFASVFVPGVDSRRTISNNGLVMEEALAQRCSLFEREPTPSLLPTPWMPPVPWPPSTAGALRVSMETRRAAWTSGLCHNSLWRRRQSSVERQKLVTHGHAQCGHCPRMPSDTCCDACERSQSGKRLTYYLMSSIKFSADVHVVNNKSWGS